MNDPGEEDPLVNLVRERLRGTRPVLDPGRWRVPLRGGVPPASLLQERLRGVRIRQAAVLVPLVERGNGPALLLTRRAEHLKDHAGQISFPGGRIEPHDQDAAQAALREADEEVGIGAADVEVLGYLDTYLTGTGFAVTPVVGRVSANASPQANPEEVAEVFEVPLAYLIDPRNHGATSRDVGGTSMEFFEIAYGRHRIWGATAGIIVGFYEVLFD
jgi:8-oxo-dGTP pyrophosphatase MutT (NUDIX family)